MVKSNSSGYKWFLKVFWLQIVECQIQFVIREHQVLNVLLKLTVSKDISVWSVLLPEITLVTFKITLWTYFKKKRTINTLKHYWNNVWWAQSKFCLICSHAKSLAHLHWNNIVTSSLFIVSNNVQAEISLCICFGYSPKLRITKRSSSNANLSI